MNTWNVFTPEDHKCETVDQTEIDGENGMEEERSWKEQIISFLSMETVRKPVPQLQED